MKSRTKWLFCLCLLAWLSTGCDSKSDITSKDPPGAMNTEWKTYYTYKNDRKQGSAERYPYSHEDSPRNVSFLNKAPLKYIIKNK